VVKLSRKWKDRASTVKGLDAERCERELNKIAKSGLLTPEAIVEMARDEDSPLHDGFTWDDSEAAKAWRIEEAKQIIRALVYVEETEHGPREVRCFVNVRDENDEGELERKGRYVPVGLAMSDPKYREYVLSIALRDAHSYAEKYRDFEELARIVKAIDTTVKQYEREHATA
jgi:hypothetical protein